MFPETPEQAGGDRSVDTDIRKLDLALAESVARIARQYAGNWLAYAGAAAAGNFCPDGRNDAPQPYTCVYEPDRHPFHEVFICVAGQCALQIGEDFFPVQAGTAAIVLPGHWHHELAAGPTEYLGIWFVMDNARCLFHLSGQTDGKGFFTLSGSALPPEAYARLMQQVTREIQGNDPLAPEMVKCCMMQLLIQARRDIAASPGIHKQGRRWIEQVAADVIRYIEDNHNRPIRLEDICHTVSMSGNYLNMLFKSVTGRTIIQYASEYKLEQAKKLLQQPYSVQEIASMLGFYDPYHFSKAFKKATGQSPSRFRKGDFTSIE